MVDTETTFNRPARWLVVALIVAAWILAGWQVVRYLRHRSPAAATVPPAALNQTPLDARAWLAAPHALPKHIRRIDDPPPARPDNVGAETAFAQDLDEQTTMRLWLWEIEGQPEQAARQIDRQLREQGYRTTGSAAVSDNEPIEQLYRRGPSLVTLHLRRRDENAKIEVTLCETQLAPAGERR